MRTIYTQTALLDFISDQVLAAAQTTKVFTVGISGLDTSGKSQLSSALASRLQEKGRKTWVVSGDSFHYPQTYKETLAEPTWGMQHAKRILNFEALIQTVLHPLRQQPDRLTLSLLDYDTGEVVPQVWTFVEAAVVVVESVYLFQPALCPYLDYKIFLQVSEETALKRAQARPRDAAFYGGEAGVAAHYTAQNFPGYRWFDETYQPLQYAHLVLDNTDWQQPILVKQTIPMPCPPLLAPLLHPSTGEKTLDKRFK